MTDLTQRTVKTGQVTYKLERPLGKGAFGEVYLAHRVRADGTIDQSREYAVKVLHAEHTEDRKKVAGFKREIRAHSVLAHASDTDSQAVPHLARLHGEGITARGDPFFVMDFARGETLDSRIRREGALPQDEVARIGVQLIEALQAIHDRGYIHRDVKGANVAVDEQGQATLLDLGLIGTQTQARRNHQRGMVVGTPAYLSFEAVTAQATPQVDRWALGVLLFESLEGRRPFEGKTLVAVARAIQAARSGGTHRPQLSDKVYPELGQVVSRLLGMCLHRGCTSAPPYASDAEVLGDLRRAARFLATRPGLGPSNRSSGEGDGRSSSRSGPRTPGRWTLDFVPFSDDEVSK